MLIRGSTEDRNHNPVLHFTYLSLLLFIKGCFLSCLGVQVVFDFICLFVYYFHVDVARR